jgi:hypothetical protein
MVSSSGVSSSATVTANFPPVSVIRAPPAMKNLQFDLRLDSRFAPEIAAAAHGPAYQEADLRGIGNYGATVNRAARIRSLVHGSQIFLSDATRDLARDALPEGGLHRAGRESAADLSRCAPSGHQPGGIGGGEGDHLPRALAQRTGCRSASLTGAAWNGRFIGAGPCYTAAALVPLQGTTGQSEGTILQCIGSSTVKVEATVDAQARAKRCILYSRPASRR